MKRTHTILFIGALVIIAVGTYLFLSSGEDFSPGWTAPLKIQEKRTFSPLISYYNEELWFAFSIAEMDGRAIKVAHSPDGVEWSSPFTLVKESSRDCSFPTSIQWLKRLDGTLWFLWTEGKSGEGCPETLYYSALTDDGTWSTPREIHRLDTLHYITDVTNAPGGGLVVLGERENRGYTVIEGGKQVPIGMGNECFVQVSNEDFEWGSPFFMTTTTFPSCVDVVLDSTGTIWAIYSESSEMKGIFFRTSQDGVSWSPPERISMGDLGSGYCLQKSDDQFVFFLYGYPGSIYVAESSDGLNWSSLRLAVKTDIIFSFDVVESDGGTLWVVFEERDGMYLTHYSEEKYSEDVQALRDFHVRNGIISLSITFLIGISWVFLSKIFSNVNSMISR